MKLIIDRFEGGFAVCEAENKDIVNIERSKLPREAREGDVIIQTSEGYMIDRNKTEERREYINKLMNELWE
ncbi:MAG: DUF3006 domain-containing protein [Thermoanaerobacteraceae bacterium]|nr:DUF3006 domain-containing protein [Thermoanaerobacteraceae bacterium]